MPVPNTNTFSLGDVIAYLNTYQVDSLGDCFQVANDALFDPAYKGSKDRLSNFRNYDNPMVIDAGSAVFDFEGIFISGSQTFHITCWGNWTIEYDNSGGGGGTVSPEAGSSGTTTITAYAGYNDTGQPKTTYVNFLYNGHIYATFEINQQG